MPVDRIWEAAKHDRGITCAYERLVLGSVGVVSRLKAADPKAEWDRCAPIGVVMCTLVMECTKAHLESMFVVAASLESAGEGGKMEELGDICGWVMVAAFGSMMRKRWMA
ncbi:hypothetical protein EDD85DRAFT_956191 [Armillaria nabsnona]|nr:hypothetical protein EDD85DRAFT_956191 [Armillaria nabsnona]